MSVVCRTVEAEPTLTGYPTPYRQAVYSPCERYRYELIIRWDHGPTLEFVMLNPSTATEQHDDPTIRRCIAFAKQWGYGAVVVRNLYAYRATDPTELVNVDDPIGPMNRTYLANAIAECTVAAWGAHPAAVGWWAGYPYDITSALKRRALYCLGTTMRGEPRHPLYVKGDTLLEPWSRPT